MICFSSLNITIQRNCQHWIHKTQDEDKQSRETVNIRYTRHKTKTNNPEKLSTLDTQNARRRQTKQKTQHITIYANKQKYREQDMSPPINNWR